jgi:hypothetical protein
MKYSITVNAVIFFVVLLFGCTTSQNSVSNNKGTEINISINLDSSIMSNDASLASWMGYAIIIADEMENFYEENPNGIYIIPFDIELLARESMIELYLDLKNNQKINEEYLYVEELILIKNANYLKEYVFFSFNPGTWINNDNLIEKNYFDWKNNNIPEHKPLILAYIKKE